MRALSRLDTSGQSAAGIPAAVQRVAQVLTSATSALFFQGLVLHCGRKTIRRDESESKDYDIVIIAVSHEWLDLKQAIILLLTLFCGAEILHGPAPPSNLERELQRVINRRTKK